MSERYTVQYSVEVCVRRERIEFRIVNTGVGWVALASASNLTDALASAKERHPQGDLVLDRDDVHVNFYPGGSIRNEFGIHTVAGRERQYDSVKRYMAEFFPGDLVLHDEVDKAIRLAFPVRTSEAA